MKVFYNAKMSTPSHGFSPSGSKPAAVVADWKRHKLDIEIVDFEPLTEADLWLAHDPAFVRRVLEGKEANGHGNTRKRVTQSCLWTGGSLVAAARQAMVDRITCSPSSGFHHASVDHCSGFCTFNSLIIAARKMIIEGRVAKVGIIDADAHYSDGTISCIEAMHLHQTVKNWTFGEHYQPNTFRQSQFMRDLKQALQSMKDDGVEFILFQAGADTHINDPLGRFQTTEELRERDTLVFDTCAAWKIPVTWLLAGGYQRTADGKIQAVLDLHRATAEEAIRVLKLQHGESVTEPTKKRIRIRDTTEENLGKGIAIIGGVRMAKADEQSDLP